MDRQFLPALFNGCGYLSMLGLKSNHVSKRSPRLKPEHIGQTCLITLLLKLSIVSLPGHHWPCNWLIVTFLLTTHDFLENDQKRKYIPCNNFSKIQNKFSTRCVTSKVAFPRWQINKISWYDGKYNVQSKTEWHADNRSLLGFLRVPWVTSYSSKCC